MPYRFNGVECDTVEELRALTGYPMNQVLANNKELVANSFVPEVKAKPFMNCKYCVNGSIASTLNPGEKISCSYCNLDGKRTEIKCAHKWKYDGHGGGHQGQYVHKCTKCGASDWFAEPLQ